MRKNLMGLLGIALLIFGLSACKKITIGANSANLSSCHESLDHPCTPGVPRGPTLSTDLATPDMATPDLATPDLATPDLATPDLGMPDMANPDLPPSDIAVQVGDMTGAGNPIDLALQKFDLGMCIGNGKNNVYGWPNPRCGADCGPNCDASEGCDPLNGNNDCRKMHPLYGDLICIQRTGQIQDGGTILEYYCTAPPSP